MGGQVYTTQDIAKVCQVSLRTVIRWVDEGRLSSFRTPGGHRRVKEEDLAKFLSSYNIPFTISSQRAKKIFVVEIHGSIRRIIQQLLRRSSDTYEVVAADSVVEAALRIGFFQPDLVILSCGEVTPELHSFCTLIKRLPETKHIKLMVLNLSATSSLTHMLSSLKADAVMVRPFSIKVVREKVLKLLGTDTPRSFRV